MEGLTREEQRRRPAYQYSQSFSLTALQASQITIKTEPDTIFVCTAMAADSTGNFRVRMHDDGSGNMWQNDFVSNVNVFGTILFPNILKTPLIIPPMSTIIIDITDTSNAANAGEITFLGYRLFTSDFSMNQFSKAPKWFQYVGSKAITASAIDLIIIQMHADMDFEIHKLLARRIGGLPTTGAFSAKLSDSDTSKSWSDRSILVQNQFGTAQNPAFPAVPILIAPNSRVRCEITELSGLGNTVEIVLEGAKRPL